MYDFVDRPVECLGNGGRFLLWAMRGWTHSMGRGSCAPAALTRGFAGVGALVALPDFHMAMTLLNREATERLTLALMIDDDAVAPAAQALTTAAARLAAVGLAPFEATCETHKESK